MAQTAIASSGPEAADTRQTPMLPVQCTVDTTTVHADGTQ
jgi:hypothetical protein